MAFTVIDKRPGEGEGTISVGLAGDATEIWEIIADANTYSTEDLRYSGLFPQVYESFHPQNSRLRFQPVTIKQDAEAPSRFTCTLKWSSEPLTPQQKEEQDDNPLDRKARIKIKTVKEKEVRHRDKYGKPKVNAAGDLFDPPIESNTSFLQIIVRKNVTSFPDWVFEYIDTVNLTGFTIKGRAIPAKRACIVDIELGEEKDDGDIAYAEAVIEIHVKKPRLPVAGENAADVPNPWQTEQLNEGLHKLSGTVRKRIMVPDDEGNDQPVAAPVLLTENGDVLTPVTIDNATYVVFDDHEYKEFADIAYLWSNA